MSDCTFTVDDEVALFANKKCFASEVVRIRDARIGACVDVLQVVASAVSRLLIERLSRTR